MGCHTRGRLAGGDSHLSGGKIAIAPCCGNLRLPLLWGMGRSWSPRPIDGVPDRVILFDGVCVFCSRWARFVIERDPEATFRFVAVQQPYGRALAERLRIDVTFPETNAVVLDG